MTDRIKGCVVTFNSDLREDDAQKLLDAIMQLRGVAMVASQPVDVSDHINRARIHHEWREKIIDLLDMRQLMGGQE